MAFVKKEINPDFRNLTIFLIGEPKTGKSTLVRDLSLLTGCSGAFLQMGNENATTLLDGVMVAENETWEDLVENLKILKKRKESGDPDLEKIEFVAIDTADEFFKILEQQAIKIANEEAQDAYQSSRNSNKSFKPVKTILQAFGGYNKGKQYTADDLATKIAANLRRAGLGTIFIGHSAVKNVKTKDGLEDVQVEKVTSSLDATYDRALTGIADVKMVIVQHYDDKDFEVETRTGFGTTKEIRHALNLGTQRVYLRQTPTINAGSRFTAGSVPEYLEFENGKIDASVIKSVLEEGMRLSKYENAHEIKAKLEKDGFNTDEFLLDEDSENIKEEELIVDELEEIVEPDPVRTEPVVKKEIDYHEKQKLIQQAYRTLDDMEIKNQVQSKVKEYGSITKLPNEVLDDLLIMMGIS